MRPLGIIEQEFAVPNPGAKVAVAEAERGLKIVMSQQCHHTTGEA